MIYHDQTKREIGGYMGIRMRPISLTPLDRSGHIMDINSEVGLPPNNKERLGSITSHGDLTNSQNGSTASQGGPRGSGKGSTASLSGP